MKAAETRHAPDVLELGEGRVVHGLDQEGMRIVHDNADTIGVRAQSVRHVGRPRDVANQGHISTAVFTDHARQMRRRPIAPRQAQHVVTGRRKGPGNARTKTFGGSREKKGWPCGSLVAHFASQTAVAFSPCSAAPTCGPTRIAMSDAG